MRVLLLAAILCSIHFRSGQAQVILSLSEIQVCRSPSPIPQLASVQLTCTSQDIALWTTSGFGDGLDDQTRVPAISLASSSTRVITTDTKTQTPSSSITLSNFTYDDHGAMITCEGGSPIHQQSATISVGPPNCTVSLRATSATADSISVEWNIESCLGIEPTAYALQWFLVGKTGDANVEVGSLASPYTISGLSPKTQYLLALFLVDYVCGTGTVTTVLAETASISYNPRISSTSTTFTAGDAGTTNVALAVVIVVLVVVSLMLAAVLLFVCVKFKICAAMKRTSYSVSSASNPNAKAWDEQVHHEMKDLPHPPPSHTRTGIVEYEDMDQSSASEDVTITSLGGRGRRSETWGLPPPPPVPRSQGVEMYEDMDQHNASEDVTMATAGGRGHRSQSWGLPPPPPIPTSQGVIEYEDMDQHSGDVTIATLSGRGHRSETWGLPPPPPLPVKDNADPQYEDLTQYNAREGVTMIANPCYDTKDS